MDQTMKGTLEILVEGGCISCGGVSLENMRGLDGKYEYR